MPTIGIAIPIPEPYGSDLRDWRESFGDPLARAIPTHVTLLPPTEVDDDELPGIAEHLAAIATDSSGFEMHLRGTGSFRPISPVVFVQVAIGVGDCEKLESQIRSGTLARDLQFAYHPHVTVAHDVPDDALERAFADLAGYEARFPVVGFSLYTHDDDGVWRVHSSYPFAR